MRKDIVMEQGQFMDKNILNHKEKEAVSRPAHTNPEARK